MKNNIAKRTFMGKIPDWLRWILFVPLAFLIPLLFVMISNIFMKSYAGISPDSFLYQLYSDIFWGGGVIVVGSAIAPRKHFIISLLLLVLCSLFVLGPYLLPDTLLEHGFPGLLHGIITTCSAMIAVYCLLKRNSS